jgi:hypothetical protein
MTALRVFCKPRSPVPCRRWAQILLTARIAGGPARIMTNPRLHILDALMLPRPVAVITRQGADQLTEAGAA